MYQCTSLVYHMTSFLTCQAIVPFYGIVRTGPQCVHHVGKSCDMNVGKIWTHWESNSRPPECITQHAPPLHHMPLQSTFMFPGLTIIRIYPLSTSSPFPFSGHLNTPGPPHSMESRLSVSVSSTSSNIGATSLT